MKLFNLHNKVAIVTGASRGIGRSIAFQLARAGAKVVISSRKQEACEAVVQEIQAEGGTAMAISASIAIKEQLQNLVQKTRDAWGPIDILVCNAASNPYYGPTTGMSDEIFNKVMHNNVLSSSWLCTMVYPDMKAKKDGAIVLVSSVGACMAQRSLARTTFPKPQTCNWHATWRLNGVPITSASIASHPASFEQRLPRPSRTTLSKRAWSKMKHPCAELASQMTLAVLRFSWPAPPASTSRVKPLWPMAA